MSKVRCSSIKGLNVPASGPELNFNRFSHGQPLDMGGCNITTGTLTINNVRITTCNSTTLNATNVICTGGDVDLGNGDQLIMPTGNSAGRAGGGSPSFGSMYVNTELDIIEMYTNKQGTPQWEKLG